MYLHLPGVIVLKKARKKTFLEFILTHIQTLRLLKSLILEIYLEMYMFMYICIYVLLLKVERISIIIKDKWLLRKLHIDIWVVSLLEIFIKNFLMFSYFQMFSIKTHQKIFFIVSHLSYLSFLYFYIILLLELLGPFLRVSFYRLFFCSMAGFLVNVIYRR